MRLFIVWLLTALVANSGVAADLVEIIDQYEEKLLAIEVEHERSSEVGLGKYRASVEAVLAKVKETGDLEKTKTVMAELERLEKEKGLAKSRPAFDQIASVHDSYVKKFALLELQTAKRVVELAERFERVMEDHQKSLVKADQIDEAEKAQAARKRIATSDKVQSARAIVARGAPASAKRFVIQAEADGYVRAGKSGSNYGKSPILNTKDDSSGNTRWGYLRFDLSPAKGTSIRSATLLLTCQGAGEQGNPGQLYAVAEDDWAEDKLAWKNKPKRGMLLAEWERPKAGETVEIDVTEAVKAELRADGKLSVCVYVKGYHGIAYCSREHEDEKARPMIRIEAN